MITAGRAREVLVKYFGFSKFREGQAEVIEAVLQGRDSIVVMPTGGGKSLCYQLPAIMIEGVTLVVSPLIALMKDQVDALTARGIPSTFINSSLGYHELNERLAATRRGRYRLVYIAPERFRNEAFTRAIAGVKVGLFAIDEAHCISHWGHDFRPDYLKLRDAAERLGRPKIIALTATATPQVRDDVVRQLGLVEPRVFVAGFDRPNLALQVLHVPGEAEKIETLKRTLANAAGSGIIYAATRKSVERISGRLKMAGFKVEAYHAGMEERERTQAQDRFMQGDLQSIVATNAFGMGIDKPDIRFVAHYHIPGSVEAYYQEVGRAGRDGLPADCLLLFNYADTRTQQFFIDGGHPTPDLIRSVYKLITSIGSERVELSTHEIASRLGIKNEMAVNSALVVLEKAGHIERGRSTDSIGLVLLKSPVEAALAAVPGDSKEARLLRDLIFTLNINDREPTEINISTVSTWLESGVPQVRRALAELAAREVISYRNGFRGKGIRVLDPSPARSLRIDRRELAARAAAEQWKLRKMIDYCYHEQCLRRFILAYFGDRKRITDCVSCSSCAPLAGQHSRRSQGVARNARVTGTLTVDGGSRPPSVSRSGTALDEFIIEQAPTGDRLRSELRQRAERARALSRLESEAEERRPGDVQRRPGRGLSDSEVVVVKKILSCVARLNDRFGKGTIAAVLCRSKSKQVVQHKLDQLSTYGLLDYMGQDEVTALIRALIDANCVEVRAGAYPTVRLSEFGRKVMQGHAEVTLDLPG